MRALLANIIYRCDLVSMFQCTRAAKKYDDQGKRQSIAVEAKLLKEAGAGKRALDLFQVRRAAMNDHFQKHA